MFSVGDATIVRVEETNLPTYPLREIFPEFTDAHLAEHRAWLAPHHYEAETGRIRLAVHSWLLQVGGKKILINSCCGNNKVKAGAALLAHAQRAISRSACRRRCASRGNRSRDVHASASRSCRLEHAAEGRKMGADISQCPLRVFQAGRRLLLKDRCRSERRARRSSAHSANASSRFSNTAGPIWSAVGHIGSTNLSRSTPRPGHSPGHVFFKLESKGQRAAFIGDVWHHLLQVYYPDWNFPKNSDAAQARVSRRKVLDYCASSGALVFPGHVGMPFAGHIEATEKGYRPNFLP